MVADEPERRLRLAALTTFAARTLQRQLGITPSGSQIQPVIIGDSAGALRIARRIRAGGFDIRAIRPPTVADGTARLRISITLHVTGQDIEQLGDLIAVATDQEKR
jgi:8-amino-7-oxononanoate synthase